MTHLSAMVTAVPAMNDGAGPYANDAVTKEECAKRLGTRLHLLKKTTAEEITT